MTLERLMAARHHMLDLISLIPNTEDQRDLRRLVGKFDIAMMENRQVEDLGQLLMMDQSLVVHPTIELHAQLLERKISQCLANHCGL